MNFTNKSCENFIEELASKSAVPGGGGASALVGAVGVALGSMVGNLTVGKKKYADVEADIILLLDKAKTIQDKLIELVDEDATVFQPLSKAYGIPKDDPARAEVLEEALKLACSVPLEIMKFTAQAIELHDEFAKKGSRLVLSDAGVGVLFCKAALQGASLNVFINTGLMTDRNYATKIESDANALLDKYCTFADEIYTYVRENI